MEIYRPLALRVRAARAVGRAVVCTSQNGGALWVAQFQWLIKEANNKNKTHLN